MRLDGPEGTRIVWAFVDPVRPGTSESGDIRMIRHLLLHGRHFEENFK